MKLQDLLILAGMNDEFQLIPMLEGPKADAVNVSIIIQLPSVGDHQIVWLDGHQCCRCDA